MEIEIKLPIEKIEIIITPYKHKIIQAFVELQFLDKNNMCLQKVRGTTIKLKSFKENETANLTVDFPAFPSGNKGKYYKAYILEDKTVYRKLSTAIIQEFMKIREENNSN